MVDFCIWLTSTWRRTNHVRGTITSISQKVYSARLSLLVSIYIRDWLFTNTSSVLRLLAMAGHTFVESIYTTLILDISCRKDV